MRHAMNILSRLAFGIGLTTCLASCTQIYKRAFGGKDSLPPGGNQVVSFAVPRSQMTDVGDFAVVPTGYLFAGALSGAGSGATQRILALDSAGNTIPALPDSGTFNLSGLRLASDILQRDGFFGIALYHPRESEEDADPTYQLFSLSAGAPQPMAGVSALPAGDRIPISQVYVPGSGQWLVSSMGYTVDNEVEFEVVNVGSSTQLYYLKLAPDASTWASGPLLDADGDNFYATLTSNAGDAGSIYLLKSSATSAAGSPATLVAQTSHGEVTLLDFRKVGAFLIFVTYDGDGLVATKVAESGFAPAAGYGDAGRLNLGGSSGDVLYFPAAAKVDGAGRVLVCGEIQKGGVSQGMGLWRMNADGSRDASFDSGKPYRVLSADLPECRRLVVLADSAVVLARAAVDDGYQYQVFRVPTN